MLLVDYAGQIMPVVDPDTGDVRKAQPFAARLGYSNCRFFEAAWTQEPHDRTAPHRRAIEFFGAVPRYVVANSP